MYVENNIQLDSLKAHGANVCGKQHTLGSLKARGAECMRKTIEDGRRVEITLVDQGNETKAIETFDAENANQVELQQAGWQVIMDNFKAYTEHN